MARVEIRRANLWAVYLSTARVSASGCRGRGANACNFLRSLRARSDYSQFPNAGMLETRTNAGSGMRLCALGAFRRRMENLRNKCKLGSDAKQRSLMENERHWGAGFLSSSFSAAIANINLGKFPSYLYVEHNASVWHWHIKMSEMINLLFFNYSLQSVKHAIFVSTFTSHIFRQRL